MTPAYDGNGDPVCPKHKKALKEGKWGLYCPTKDDSTERGFRSLKFKEIWTTLMVLANLTRRMGVGVAKSPHLGEPA